jgi:SAM-dependent methyltransferase
MVDDLRAFYERNDETARLLTGEGRVEFLRTQPILRNALEPGSRILDVGGAGGVHADWLIADGHEVQIVDIVPLHLDHARARGLNAKFGDARRLPQANATFDAVLLLGPLYHLLDASDRICALAEARRVLRPRGLLAAAVVNRLAVALNYLRSGSHDAPSNQAATRIATNGFDDTGDRLGVFYFHTLDELGQEIGDAGFDTLTLRGVEGPAWPLIQPTASANDPALARAIEIAELADGDDSLTGASCHVLALARA